MKTNVTLVFLMLGLSLFAQTDNSAELVAKYTFETGLVNELNSAVSGEALAEENGTLPTFEQNEERGGQVLHVYFGYTGDNNSSLTTSYVQFPNPLQGIENLSGASVSLWVNRLDNDLWDAIWGFLDEDNSDDVDGRFYLTPNAYLGFNGTGGWFDCNWPENVTDAIAQSEWNMVTVTVNTGGFTIYVNGEKRYDKTTYATWGAIDDITSADFNYSNVINLIKSAVNFYLGYGSWWGSSPLLIDDLSIYNGVLTDTEVTDLYNSYTKIENFVFDSEINWIYDKQANTISINGLKGDKKIELLNLTGQVISSTKQSTIYTGNLNKGVYLLKIKEGNASSVKKIMIL